MIIMDATMACESFIRDCDILYNDYMMSSMIANEGTAIDTIKAGASAAWKKIKELAAKIWQAITNVGHIIGTLFNKVRASMVKIPDTAIIEETDEWVLYEKETKKIGLLAQMTEKLNNIGAKIKGTSEKIIKHKGFTFEEYEESVNDVCRQADLLQDHAMEMLRRMQARAATANESHGAAMEAGAGKKINIKSIKDSILNAMKAAKSGIDANTANVASVKNDVNAAAAEGSVDGSAPQKQKLLAKLLKALTTIGNVFKSASVSIGNAFKRLISFTNRNKSTVSEYDGPEPELA